MFWKKSLLDRTEAWDCCTIQRSFITITRWIREKTMFLFAIFFFYSLQSYLWHVSLTSFQLHIESLIKELNFFWLNLYLDAPMKQLFWRTYKIAQIDIFFHTMLTDNHNHVTARFSFRLTWKHNTTPRHLFFADAFKPCFSTAVKIKLLKVEMKSADDLMQPNLTDHIFLLKYSFCPRDNMH